MTWVQSPPSADGDEFTALLGLRAPFQRRHEELMERIWRQDGPDPRLLELCRLRIAGLHGSTYDSALRSAPAIAAGLTEETVADLPRYSTSPLFSEQERLAVAFAEHYVMDVHGISDDEFAAVAAGMTPAQMTAFTFALGIFDGMTRFRAILGIRADGGSRTVSPVSA